MNTLREKYINRKIIQYETILLKLAGTYVDVFVQFQRP